MVKSLIFWPKKRTNPFEKFDLLNLFETSLFCSKKYSFLFLILKNNLFCVSLLKKTHMVKSSIFWQEHSLTPFEKSNFGDFLKLPFSDLKSIIFYPEYLKGIFSSLACQKSTHGKKFDFLKRTMAIFYTFFKSSLFCSKKYSFLSRLSKNNLFCI